MKSYKKLRYTGNENGWHEPIVQLGITKMHDHQAAELNDQFRNTGVKYQETTDKPSTETTTNAADHGEPNLVVKDGQLVKTDNKPDDKAKELEKNGKDGIDPKTVQQDAKATDQDAFVKSDGEVKHAEIQKPKEEIKGAANTPA